MIGESFHFYFMFFSFFHHKRGRKIKRFLIKIDLLWTSRQDSAIIRLLEAEMTVNIQSYKQCNLFSFYEILRRRRGASMKKIIMLWIVISILGGCTSKTQINKDATSDFVDEEVIIDFPTKVSNPGKPISGGTLKYAVQAHSFNGVFNRMLYTTAIDDEIISIFNPGILGYDADYQIDDSGFAKVNYDREQKAVTFKIPQGEKWSDGDDITIDDVIFPYYVIGHPDYTGSRYGESFENVVGMREYHSGKSDTISGLERIDDYTLKVTYKRFNQSMLQSGGGLSQFMEPSHLLEDIPVAQLENSPYVRSKPVGFGPFVVKSIVPGESVVFEANDYYYKGRPKINKLQVDAVSPNTILAEFKSGNYDLIQLPVSQYPQIKEARNFKVLGMINNVVTYLGFRQGHWNERAGMNVANPKAKLSDKNLRLALSYAIDNQSVVQEFYQGLRLPANSLITPNFGESFYDKSLTLPDYDPEKAKSILKEAGYIDVDGDGLVEDKNGQSMTLGYAAIAADVTSEPLAHYYIQMWREIGLDVEIVDGKLMGLSTFYQRLAKDDPEIDIFEANITIGGDPSPQNIWARNAAFNHSRWTNPRNDALLADIQSDMSFDESYRQEAYYAWQEFMKEELPVYPTMFRYDLTAVNNRVSEWDVGSGSHIAWEEIYLTADQPLKE